MSGVLFKIVKCFGCNKQKIFFETKMAQRSITSFFSTVPKKVEQNVTAAAKNSKSPKEKKLVDSVENSSAKRKRVLESSSSLERNAVNSSEDEAKSVNDKKEKRNSFKRIKKNSTSSSDESSNEQNGDLNKSEDKYSDTNNKVDGSKSEEEKKESPKKETKKTPLKPRKSDAKKKDTKAKSKKIDKKDEKPKKESSKDTKTSPEKSEATIEEQTDGKNKDNDKAKPSQTTVNLKNKQTNESLNYNPDSSKYHPINDAIWKENQKVPYIALTRTFEIIEGVSARLKIIEILSNYFRSVIALSPQDLLPSIYLCLNQLGPAYEGIELGIAETNLIKAIAQCTGRSLAQIKADMKEIGDLGVVAEGSRLNQKMMFQPAPLTVTTVFTKLREIGMTSGNLSNSKKIDKIQSLFVACRFSEAKFLIRSLAGKLRIGLADQSVLQALALACTMTPPEQERPCTILNVSKDKSADAFKSLYDKTALIIKTTYCQCPNYDKIIPVLLSKGVKELPNECKLTPGVPLKPMLAHPTKGIQEVLSRFSGLKFSCEWKYDGERAQIHINENGKVNIYSRNQENNTSKYPDIIARVKETCQDTVKSCIIDSEAVAWDTETKEILPFQVLSTRKRKDANKEDIKVQVCVFMFDLLYINGKPLVEETFQERRKLLKEHFKEIEGQWKFAHSFDVDSMEEVQEVLDEAIKGKCEGLMIKTLEKDATYEIAKRSRNWLKLKKDYLEGVGDTLDLVVIGGYIGKGKRTGQYGGFLLACYDQESEEYQTICKLGTGFSEEDLAKHSELLKECRLDGPKTYYRYDSSAHQPDHWFEPKYVWEIKCADLSLSPVHNAAKGIVDSEKGISLRFPRFIRIRDDKNVDDATSAQQIADMYLNQEQIKNSTSSTAAAEEDFY